ncbi:MAG: plastocyanin/azurin family copper-binding protein [Terriglobia bacterium]|nr:plastocyanin/azurin family copper-binding protein [Terriglobia bacterium]
MRQMQRNLVVITVLLSFAAAAWAGEITGKVSGVKGKSVVYLEAPAGKTYPAPTQQPVMNQKGLMFEPHVMVVQQGTTVEFLNSDAVQHNVFWPSISGDKKLGHNLGTWPQGEKRAFKFDHPGVVPLLCNVHPEMSGFIVVSPTPYFAETDANGNYKITNVPDGDYKAVAWHEGKKDQEKPLKVAGATTTDFQLK